MRTGTLELEGQIIQTEIDVPSKWETIELGDNSADNGRIRIDNDGKIVWRNVLNTDNAGSIYIDISNRFFIETNGFKFIRDNQGYTGINTNVPMAPLHVGGNAIIDSTLTTSGLVITTSDVIVNFNADMVDGYHFNQPLLTTSSPTFNGGFTTSGVTNLTTGFNVIGLGSFFNGANKFGIDVNDSATRFYASGPDSTTAGTYEFHIIASDGDPDTIAIKIANNGNVGIGTTNPTQKFHVKGGNTNNFLVDNDGTQYTEINIANSGTFKTGWGWDNTNSLSYFNIVGGGKYSLNGGNVGIGTGADSLPYKLTVAGSIGTAHNAHIIARYTSSENYKATLGWNHLQLGNNGPNDIVAGRTNVNGYFRFIVNSTNDYSYDNSNGTIAMTIGTTGNVTVTGTITENSTIKIKQNIKPILSALSIIKKLQGITFDRKDGNSQNEAGLIAEQVYEILPNVVTKDKQGNIIGIQYTRLIAYLIEAIKELSWQT